MNDQKIKVDVDDPIMNISGVAKLLKVSKTSIYHWLTAPNDDGPKIPHFRIGRTLRFRRSEIESYIDKIEKNRC